VQVTLNADDQLWFQAGVTDQYRIAREQWGLDDTQLTAIAATGMQVAGVSRSTRARFQLYLDRWLLAAPSTNGEVPSR
jgi:adenosine deaminase